MAWQASMGQREDLFRVKVVINGTDGNTVKFTCDSLDGGAVTAKETKYRPGNGTQDEVTLGGARSVSNVTVAVLQTYAIYQNQAWMQSQVGKGSMTVSKQPLDVNGSPFGKALNYGGLLNGVTPPKASSDSDAAAIISLELSAVTPITQG